MFIKKELESPKKEIIDEKELDNLQNKLTNIYSTFLENDILKINLKKDKLLQKFENFKNEKENEIDKLNNQVENQNKDNRNMFILFLWLNFQILLPSLDLNQFIFSNEFTLKDLFIDFQKK